METYRHNKPTCRKFRQTKSCKNNSRRCDRFAAYNALPVNWSSPIIEQVFLPAHAATSGDFVIENLAAEFRLGDKTTATRTIKVSGNINPALTGQAVVLTITP